MDATLSKRSQIQHGPAALAQALAALAHSSCLEFCTPGHRRGHAMERLLETANRPGAEFGAPMSPATLVVAGGR